jgi:nicotinamide-nucleotide amidase
MSSQVLADAEVAAAVPPLLLGRGQTVGCAESLTGGQLAALLSGPAGASAVFVGGVVSYATEVKRSLLGVTADRVVSAECAVQMAVGARRLLGVDWALATTGVAGPDRQEDQPVGTVHLGIAGPSGARSVLLALEGDRTEIRRAACIGALRLLTVELGDG